MSQYPSEGDTHVVERSFSTEEVRQFAALSNDDQPRHTEPDEDGRLLVHGLLTATLPTEVGGDLGVLGRSFTFEFQRPVYTGDSVRCECVVERVEERDDRYDLSVDVTCTRKVDARPDSESESEVVMRGTVTGLVRKS
ncbi:acyl dehydratase MaoC [Halogeometricum pallidum JCM 14848]|uniref:Acyl dehydratase MaoC n=1 Tax=Halogeometricum pallidum JCM 14848 TaxID=1227487 RepID=M0DK16_HALPD|nr:MaoC/PaaZ C-terminal domain-containing protein [Halogeometricum pallidum]ELZ35027.1 acyl dehydratase MaoC [Halogeometricum pallidum JCM 14848]